jgi:hypothetical protein
MRLMTMLMIITLVIGHGLSYAAAICHHQDAQEHSLALLSHDSKVAAVAMNEETAGDLASSEGTAFSASAAAWAADMLPLPRLQAPIRTLQPVRSPIANSPVLASQSVAPLLEPPAA